jgi:hypothetical protein
MQIAKDAIIISILEHFKTHDKYRLVVKSALDYIQCKDTNNPYHNAYHCMLVARNALSYTVNSNGVSISDKGIIAVAGLFHDFNHSGKPLSEKKDSLNIQKAITGLNQFTLTLTDSLFNYLPYYFWNSIAGSITSTEAVLNNGTLSFPNHPHTLHTYIRDADVTMLYWDDGRLTMSGLAQEMCLPYDHDFKVKSSEFFNNVTLFTPAANKLRSDTAPMIKEWLTTPCKKMSCIAG